MEKTEQNLLIEFSDELLDLKELVSPQNREEFFEKLLHTVMVAATWGASLNESPEKQ